LTAISAYPNPFNPTTTLSFALPIQSDVTITIYNMQGRQVSTLIDGNMEAGYHSVVWNADAQASGVYFVKMMTSEFTKTQKLMLVK
jgi:flagellar hook assembly protein FlgD